MLASRVRVVSLGRVVSIGRAVRRASTQAQGVGVESGAGAGVVFRKLRGADRGIALYGLDSPRHRNALGFELVAGMREVHRILRQDTSISVVVLHSLVPGVFCAGANLKERLKMSDEEVASFVRGLRGALAEVEELPMPTVCALDGAALGGGLELALACDLRVAAASARLGLVETSRGLLPGAGGTQRLPRLIQTNLAKELIFTSRIITGEEAYRLGVVNHVVEQNETQTAAFERAMGLAREIAANAPVALRMAKLAINEGTQLPLREGYEVEQRCYERNIPTRDRKEGMLSFIEKRKPVYEGH